MKFTYRILFLLMLILFLVVSCVPASEEVSSTASSSSTESSSTEVNLQSMSPEDLARAYIVARNAYNLDQAKPILADNVKIVTNGDSYTIEEEASFLKYAEAVGLNWDVVSCEVSSTNAVNCPIRMSSNVSKAVGIDSVAGSAFDFVISDNKIASVDLKLNLTLWGPEVFRKLRSYIQVNHPDDIGTMFVNGDVVGVSDEGIALWKTYAAEFVASR